MMSNEEHSEYISEVLAPNFNDIYYTLEKYTKELPNIDEVLTITSDEFTNNYDSNIFTVPYDLFQDCNLKHMIALHLILDEKMHEKTFDINLEECYQIEKTLMLLIEDSTRQEDVSVHLDPEIRDQYSDDLFNIPIHMYNECDYKNFSILQWILDEKIHHLEQIETNII